ncbi:TPA: fibrinogen-binding protein [Staphylococcus aureus]|uniref:fibrinogen-binding protein n=1 Tax=Staphylococcus aureus TaxID=1280 RepID=UPI001E4095B0|nr:fibrinogen-binding protein [Staphylococcus aureus]UFA57485.1 fibrinogen-binding protein [Staphylococcus aureus]HDD0308547.1 fibrinogen-binding protein [Staphylococcus aureus]HDD0309463.1 fibrinogen-binding protein [Staphylococcus aureus]HDD0312250.1 fibrinogen-binding protein [Staphylococcus aureus]HDD0316862.1 fibrinogen-binding protein [Staphylococcus aureus]
MKKKFMAKALLALAAVGVTTTGIAASADASTDNGYGPREKKPVAINYNIVEYNNGTYKYQSRPKFNKTPKYIKFRHDYNIVEYNDGTFGYGPRSEVKKSQVQNTKVKPEGQTLAQADPALEAKLSKAKILVAEFDQKRTVKAHRAAQKAVNILPSHITEIKKDKKILQDRIDSILKQKLVK